MHDPRILLLIVTLLLSAGANAERVPAQADTGDDGLEHRIEFPELRGDTTAALRCAARLQKNGRMKDNGCYVESPADQIFVEPINRAARRARFKPAMLDGRAQEIYLQYRVQFVKKDDDEQVTVWLNPGVAENVEAYGPHHVAAQRVIGKERWQDVCPERADYLLWLKAHVAENGAASSASLTHGAGLNPSPRCRDAILATIEESEFFPALADGEPVPSTYMEPFGN